MFNISLYRLIKLHKDKSKVNTNNLFNYASRGIPLQSHGVRRNCALNSVILDEDYYICRKCEHFNLCSHGLGRGLA